MYSSPAWMTIPFIGKPRDAYQWLTDIELTIPRCMALLRIQGDLRAFFETSIPPNVNVGPCHDLTRKLIVELDAWATTYPTLTKGSRRTCRGLADPFTATMASNYVATRLVLNMLMYKMSTQSNSPPASLGSTDLKYVTEATECAQAVLDAAADIDKAPTSGVDLLRNIASIICVASAAPTSQLGNDAGKVLQRWASKIAGHTVVWHPTKK